MKSMAQSQLKNRRREDYKYHLEYRTRWSDNDMYHHMNNSVYHFLYDSIVNSYLIERCKLDPAASAASSQAGQVGQQMRQQMGQQTGQMGLVVHSSSDFFSPVGFPAVLDLALRVSRLGASSATYEIAVFQRGAAPVKAVGSFVHVFVDRITRRPAPAGMDPSIREGLALLLDHDEAKL